MQFELVSKLKNFTKYACLQKAYKKNARLSKKTNYIEKSFKTVHLKQETMEKECGSVPSINEENKLKKLLKIATIEIMKKIQLLKESGKTS